MSFCGNYAYLLHFFRQPYEKFVNFSYPGQLDKFYAFCKNVLRILPQQTVQVTKIIDKKVKNIISISRQLRVNYAWNCSV